MNIPHPCRGQTVVGVAIALPEPLAALVRRLRADAHDPFALIVPPHVTLLPPTCVSDHDIPAVREHLESICTKTAPFMIHLQGSDTFRPISPVVYLAVKQGAHECADLESAVRSGPLARELRFEYHPHVTLAQEVDDTNLDRAAQAGAGVDVSFAVEGLYLYGLTDEDTWELLDAPRFGLPTP